MGRIYTRQERFAEAIEELSIAKKTSGGSTEPIMQLGYAQATSGDRAAAQAAIEELKTFDRENNVPAYNYAMIYNGLGERDEELSYLEKSLEEREVQISFIGIDTRWNELRDDPRFQNLLRRVGLAQ